MSLTPCPYFCAVLKRKYRVVHLEIKLPCHLWLRDVNVLLHVEWVVAHAVQVRRVFGEFLESGLGDLQRKNIAKKSTRNFYGWFAYLCLQHHFQELSLDHHRLQVNQSAAKRDIITWFFRIDTRALQFPNFLLLVLIGVLWKYGVRYADVWLVGLGAVAGHRNNVVVHLEWQNHW